MSGNIEPYELHASKPCSFIVYSFKTKEELFNKYIELMKDRTWKDFGRFLFYENLQMDIEGKLLELDRQDLITCLKNKPFFKRYNKEH